MNSILAENGGCFADEMIRSVGVYNYGKKDIVNMLLVVTYSKVNSVKLFYYLSNFRYIFSPFKGSYGCRSWYVIFVSVSL